MARARRPAHLPTIDPRGAGESEVNALAALGGEAVTAVDEAELRAVAGRGAKLRSHGLAVGFAPLEQEPGPVGTGRHDVAVEVGLAGGTGPEESEPCIAVADCYCD